MKTRTAGACLAAICCAVLLVFSLFPAVTHADQERNVLEGLKQGSSQQTDSPTGGQDVPALPGSDTPSVWSVLLQVVFSLGLVAVLIYLLLRFLASRQFGGLGSGPIKVIGAISLGNGKSLQVVMVGDSLYILGVGEDVRLLRHIPAGEEMDVILSEAEMKPIAAKGVREWLNQLRGNKSHRELTEEPPQTAGSFEELLKQQWNAVNHSQTHLWDEQDRPPTGGRS